MEIVKPFNQLGDKELIALTEPEIEYYINLKKAETGVKLIAPPEVPTYQTLPEKDFVVYGAAGFYFDTQEAAQAVAFAVNQQASGLYNLSYDYYNSDRKDQYASKDESDLAAVTVTHCYSRATYDRIKHIMASNKRIKEAYETMEQEYKAEVDKSTDLIADIRNAISNAYDRIAKIESYKDYIREYLRLANGNAETAWNFFKKAYTVTPEEENKILESEEYLEALRSY